ncbi:MAG: hypothetical protein AAF092_05240 [Pseudomonadota bacterium]
MTLLEELLTVSDKYLFLHRGLKRTTLSSRMLGDSRTLDQIAEGADLTTERLGRAVSWLCDNWPEDVDRAPASALAERVFRPVEALQDTAA